MNPRPGVCAAFARVTAGLLTVVMLVLSPVQAYPLPPVSELAESGWRVRGEGEMRWFGFKLYDAQLWVAGAASPVDETAHVLAIRYARAIEGRRLVDTSIDEIRRLGEQDEVRLQRWRSELFRALPSVQSGETLVGLHDPGRGARFWHQGRLTATIDDPALARAFFAIWLDERTREPELRARLLGLVP